MSSVWDFALSSSAGRIALSFPAPVGIWKSNKKGVYGPDLRKCAGQDSNLRPAA
jgi:hypothetical protein